ncbi:MAG: hypothetical protein ACKVW3_13020 [Phycisphaerales bacterium]
MASIVWPAGLPQAPIVARYSQVDQDRTVRSAMDVGPAKVRRRATAAIETCEIELKLTRAQVATLKTFFRDTAQAGAVPFEWKHHQTGNPIDYRFTRPPTFSPSAPRQAAGTEYWMASFTLEAMPGTEITSPPPPPPPGPQQPGDLVFVFDDLIVGGTLEAEAMLLHADEPDAITPTPEDMPFVFVGEIAADDPLLPSIIGVGSEGTAGTTGTSLSTSAGSAGAGGHDTD